jgi:hypothetical protein
MVYFPNPYSHAHEKVIQRHPHIRSSGWPDDASLIADGILIFLHPLSLFNVIQIFYYDRFFCFVCPSSDSALPLMKAKREWKRTSENDIHRYRAAARSFVSCSALRTFFESCLSIVYFFFFFSYSPLPLVLYEYDDENNICVSFLSPFWRLLIGWEYNQKRERERNTC